MLDMFGEIHTKNLNEQEVTVLQYLDGSIISNISQLYRKPNNSKNYQYEECQKALSFLLACKSGVEVNRNTELVTALNRSECVS